MAFNHKTCITFHFNFSLDSQAHNSKYISYSPLCKFQIFFSLIKSQTAHHPFLFSFFARLFGRLYGLPFASIYLCVLDYYFLSIHSSFFTVRCRRWPFLQHNFNNILLVHHHNNHATTATLPTLCPHFWSHLQRIKIHQLFSIIFIFFTPS